MVDYSDRMREDLKLGVLRGMVDRVARDIVDGRVKRKEAEREIERVREKAKLLIPDMMDRYDMIYGSRFKRLLEQFVLEEDAQSHNTDDRFR
jgi:hypothetical protein